MKTAVKRERVWHRATNPEGVRQKLRECRYFLAQMVEHENATDQEKFLFNVSAFMSAFRTVAYRLYGVTQTRAGKAAKEALECRVENCAQVDFLIGRTNLEMHGDGTVVLRKYVLERIPGQSGRRPRTRFESREKSHWPNVHGVRVRQTDGWQFFEHSKDLIMFCDEALVMINTFVDDSLNGRSAQSAP